VLKNLWYKEGRCLRKKLKLSASRKVGRRSANKGGRTSQLKMPKGVGGLWYMRKFQITYWRGMNASTAGKKRRAESDLVDKLRGIGEKRGGDLRADIIS